MRRAVAILKYVPAVLCGLLVVAWVVSFLNFRYGTVTLSWQEDLKPSLMHGSETATWLGRLKSENVDVPISEPLADGSFRLRTAQVHVLAVPIPLVVSLLLPLGIGPGVRFRFPLWSYFAWTALVAAELAYYLR